MRQEKLKQIKEMIPLMKSMVDEDLAICIWDREGTVLYFQKAETFPLHFDVGYKHEDKNDKLFEAMETGKTLHNILPKEVFGVEIEGNIVPIFDDGEVVGCITCVFSKEKINELQNKADEMKNVLKEYEDSIRDILQATIDSAGYLKEINQFMNKLGESVRGVYNVVDCIKGNTSRTKMLALNASIEAARAGENGKGFAIVANEMGKLSQMSTESVTDINNTLGDMTKSIEAVANAINQIDQVSFNNSELVEKILSSFNKVVE